MRITSVVAISAVVLASAGVGFAATGGGNDGSGNGNDGNRAGAAARVPQYCIADAQIFSGSASNTARVMTQEQRLSVEDPRVIGSQAEFLSAATNRALADAQALEKNAVATNPQAVPAIRDAMGHLVAAQAQTNELVRLSRSGGLGPAYQTTVSAAYDHLNSADNALRSIAKQYPGTTGPSTQPPPSGAGKGAGGAGEKGTGGGAGQRGK